MCRPQGYTFSKGIIFVEISLAKGIIFTKIDLANGTILQLWAAHRTPLPEI